jgi:anaerobic selenocysteine-containing dehydrogenase
MPAGPARGLLLDAAPRLVHASSMTRHSATLLGLRPLVNVRLSTHDARALGLEDGETARVVAGSREVLRRVVVDPSVPRGIAVSGWYGVGGGAGALYVDDALPVFVEIRKSP